MGSLPRPAAGLLALLLAVAAAPAPAPTLAAIAAANGHPAFEHRRFTAHVVRDGRMVDLSVDIEGNRRLERACAGPVCAGEWFDGAQRWTFGPNGTPLPDDDADLPFWKTFVAIASLAWTEPAFLSGGGQVRALGIGSGGARYEVRAAGGSALVAVVNPQTLAPAGIERPGATTFEPDDARLAPTERIATALEAPRAVQPEMHGAQAVPLLAAPLPIVPCRLHDVAARCLIDTGTTPTALTLAFAERLHLEPAGELVISGFTHDATGIVEAGPLTIGPATWPALHFAVAPIAGDLGFDVLVGNDVVAAAPLRLDPRAHRLTFGSSGNGIVLPLHFHDGAAYAPLDLRGRERAALVDSGDTATISIGYDDFRRELSDLPVQRRAEARGIGGGSDAFFVDVDARAENLVLRRATLRVTRTQHGAHLGWGLAQHCAGGLAIDEAARHVVCVSGS